MQFLETITLEQSSINQTKTRIKMIKRVKCGGKKKEQLMTPGTTSSVKNGADFVMAAKKSGTWVWMNVEIYQDILCTRM